MADPGELRRALDARGVTWPAQLEWQRELVSTNDRLKGLARAGAPEWTAVLADVQTGGRGREGRSWVSPPGGLYLSVLLRPRFAAVSVLPLAAGVAVAEAAAELGVHAELKWPNDVQVSGRKLAGILSEAASGAGGVEWVVLGIGVNVGFAVAVLPEPLRGTTASLAEAGSPPAVAAVAAAVLAGVRVWYDALASSPAAVVSAWRRRSVAWWGESVEIRTGTETLRGRFLDVDDEGALLLALPDGRTRRVLCGEVAQARRTG
jgi:BirA family transcriptional regulator, biotin operon repressor / biotin---[acetyl-CoA-carboxylase] ligase